MKVQLEEHWGSDLKTVNMARVSFNKRTPKFRGKDERLIRYLGDHGHDTPMNHNGMTLHIKVPIFVHRQLIKHEYIIWSEVSRRYVDDEPEFYWPEKWRAKAEDKKQGSSDKEIDVEDWVYFANDGALDSYEFLLDKGVAPEQARMVLPLSIYTEAYASGFLSSWAKLVNLRDHDDAQEETREVARHIDEIAEDLFPHSWRALRDA